MPEAKGDHGDIDAGLQQVYGDRMPRHIPREIRRRVSSGYFLATFSAASCGRSVTLVRVKRPPMRFGNNRCSDRLDSALSTIAQSVLLCCSISCQRFRAYEALSRSSLLTNNLGNPWRRLMLA